MRNMRSKYVKSKCVCIGTSGYDDDCWCCTLFIFFIVFLLHYKTEMSNGGNNKDINVRKR